jgi:hypothetical protein
MDKKKEKEMDSIQWVSLLSYYKTSGANGLVIAQKIEVAFEFPS